MKKEFIELYKELFNRGEILKAQQLVNNCVPLELKKDSDILKIKEEVNSHIDQIKDWSINGRLYPGTHAVVQFDMFPKFVLAKDKIIKHGNVDKILDVGCYSGVFVNEMRKNGFTSYGVDIHKELMDILNNEYPNKKYQFGTYRSGSIEDLPYGQNNFDVVTAFDILEHVIDFDKALSEIERVCKSGGLIIINLPRMTPGYIDESLEHMRMFDDEDINRIWGHKKNFKFEFCNDELGRPTSFITYIND